MATPLFIDDTVRAAFTALREQAAKTPVDMRTIVARMKNREGKRAHMRQMTRQTVELPFGWAVTFSIEIGHPGGAARHMSLSSPAQGRIPTPEAVWMVAEELGFTSGLEACMVFPEELLGHGQAISVIQLIHSGASGTA
jgi:hypothetical protein